MVHKVEGKEIQEDLSIDRMVEIRTVLEKIRPLDQKLCYQVEKLIKAANTGSTSKFVSLVILSLKLL